MTTKTIACIDCGESVPYGRLSCPACGALLASVVGAIRSPVHVAVDGETEADPEPDAGAEVEPESKPDAEPEPEAEPEPVAVEAAVAARPASPFPPTPAPPPWTSVEESEAVLAPRPYRPLGTDGSDASSASLAAYRPPAFALSAATAAGPAWPGSGGSAAIGTPAPTTVAGADDAIEVDPAARYVEIAGWFVVVGAAMSALGFLLPWSRVVIGAAHVGGYFDGWGLASPSHVVVLAGLLVVLGLGIVPTPVPAWLRIGVLGLAAGGLLVGLAWPYVVGPLGADVGVMVAALGGIALGIGGVVGSWATRHVSEEPSV